MTGKKSLFKFFTLYSFASLCIIFALAVCVSAQAKPAAAEAQKAEAIKLIDQNRYIDALAILEKIAPLYPNDAEVQANFGVAVMVNSVTLTTPEARKKERVRGLQILAKAKRLGTEDTKALHFLDNFPADGGEDDNFTSDNPEVEKALREGEAFFGRGDYDKAFAAYEKAYKLNPKSYEAALFMGDSLYAQRKYKESEIWFAKAVEIEPNREMAHRFWGDALLGQKKIVEARDRFVEALIAEPFSRMSWENLSKWSAAAETNLTPVEIAPPGNEPIGEIKIDEKLLKTEDGTIHWKLYRTAREVQFLDKTIKKQRYTLADEAAAWRKTAEAARRDLKAGKLKYPDKSLVNLVKLDDDGSLEPYILLLRPSESFGEDFIDYREKNRARLKRFIIEYIIGTKV